MNLHNNKTFRRILGIFIMPFLYIRVPFLLGLYTCILLFISNRDPVFITMCFIFYTVFMYCILGIFWQMDNWTDFLIDTFDIKYTEEGHWKKSFYFSDYPIIKIRDTEYKLHVVRVGATYEPKGQLQRSVIFYWLFGK